MIKKNQADLMAALQKEEGYNFRTFELVSEGEFLPSDADWNYKDIPHLKNVHNLVEGFTAYAGNDFVGCIFVQKMFGGLVKIPLSVFNYQSAKNEQTYFTTLFWFILIIRTSYEQVGELQTKVTTKYAIAARGIMKFLLPVIFPLMKWSIKKNYDDLMTGDIPMRNRRGELRKMGYCFAGDNKDYSFVETSNIMESNLIAPQNQSASEFILLKDIVVGLEKQNPAFYGKADLFGFQAYKNGTVIKFFPRTCIHEGACLDNRKSGEIVRCPWHGRLHKPLLEVDLLSSKIAAVRVEMDETGLRMVVK